MLAPGAAQFRRLPVHTMPSAATRRLYEDQIPSFMSVFDLDREAMDDQATVVDPKIISFAVDAKLSSCSDQQQSAFSPSAIAAPSISSIPCDPTHRHHDSTSTQMSESTDSSPTTTMSCTDSSSLSDPSPSSSPDSPVNLLPLAAFPGPSFSGLPAIASLAVNDANRIQRPVTSPSPRRRNMKGLSIQPPFMSPTLSTSLMSEPSSPSFIKPQIPGMKRKPSQLSLKTNTNDLVKTTLEVPQSPSIFIPPILQRRALKHSTSSPHMLSSLRSATFGPVGGMTIPTVLERNESGLSEFLRPSRPTAPAGFDSTILEEDSPIKTQIANRAAYEFEPYHEQEANEDQKSPGYPDGPIAIYADNVFLYLEPTAEEASRFDVVINVAREVSNPFQAGPDRKAAKPSTQQSAPKLESVLEPVVETETEHLPMPAFASTLPARAPGVAPSKLSFTPPECLPAHDDSTPTTPKASRRLEEPEYIHIPWDHNTDIGADLMMLCEMIEKKTQDGKKVLIHCQQGASRSASLIIAYGIYLNPELSVNDAYYAAQSKSKWISPNMRLMYCLQDFQKDVGKARQTPSASLRPRSGRSPTKHRATLSVDAINLAPKKPLSAPLPTEEDSAGASSFLSPKRGPTRPRGNSTPNSREAVSPGPSSAPPTFSWSEREDPNDWQKFGRFPPSVSTVAPTVAPTAAPTAAPAIPTIVPPVNLAPALPVVPTLTKPPSRKARAPPSLGFGLSPSPGSMVKPPPSPGFAAHRFGKFPGIDISSCNKDAAIASTSVSMGARDNSTSGPSDNNIIFSAPNPLALSEFSLFSPGLPPAGFGESRSFGDVLFGPPPSFESKIKPPQPLHFTEPPASEIAVPVRPQFPLEDALMSPRAETMTNNPLHEPFAEMTGLRFVEVPPTPGDDLFSPREAMFPRDPFTFGCPTQVADPRSPPTKGETPIVRSIDDLI